MLLTVLCVYVCLLSTIDLTHAQCVLQTCDHCGIDDACMVYYVADIHNVTHCIELIDNITVLAVEYRPEENRCLCASCTDLSYSSTNARTYTYTCSSDCPSFAVSRMMFNEIDRAPSSVHQLSTITTCLSVCLAEKCWMYDASYTQCRMYSMCGPTHDCNTNSALIYYTVYRQCIPDCGVPMSLTNGLVSYNGSLVDDMATYTCNPGFLLFGENMSVCQNNSHWSMADPICELITTSTTTNATTTYTQTTSTGQTTTVGNGSDTSNTTLTETTVTTDSSTAVTTNPTTIVTTNPTTSVTTNPTTPVTTYTVTSETTNPTPSVTTSPTNAIPTSGTSLITQTTTATNGDDGQFNASKYSDIKPLYIWPCYCNSNRFSDNMTDADVLRQLIAETKIDKKSTSAALNKLVSKRDTRTSSNAVGVVGIVFLTLELCIIIILDVSKVYILSKERDVKNEDA